MKHTILSQYMLQAFLIGIGTTIFTLFGLSNITCYNNKYIAKAATIQEKFTQIPKKGYCSLID